MQGQRTCIVHGSGYFGEINERLERSFSVDLTGVNYNSITKLNINGALYYRELSKRNKNDFEGVV